ncbi:MAG: glycosyltransferase family 39 protein [Bryobacteraceae bacterium]
MKRWTLALAALLALAIIRLWLMPLASSFWTDETGTVFVIRYGASHPSAALLPGLLGSIYFVLPRIAVALGGFSEVVFRLPSTLAMGVALYLIARLAARLIHPEAAWFAAFACLTMHGFNFQAADARPYALGTVIMAAALWFLVGWLDRGRWRDAVLFVVFAALLWQVHPLYCPFYLVFAGYAAARLFSKDTSVTWLRAGAVFALVALALVPSGIEALGLSHDARAHVIASLPGPWALFHSMVPVLLGGCWAGTWLISRIFHGSPDAPTPARSSLVLIALWWLWPPACLFALSHLAGISVFVQRYYSLALPGAALAGAALASRHIPSRMWRPLAVALGLGVVLLRPDWRQLWPAHANMDWRGAARAIDQLTPGPATPVIFPSPFVETQAPLWHPGYPLPSALYSPLVAYPLRGRVVPFPFSTSPPDWEPFAAALVQSTLPASGRFFVYGHRLNAYFWENWFGRRPELAGWTSRRLGPFGDVVAVEFDRPESR